MFESLGRCEDQQNPVVLFYFFFHVGQSQEQVCAASHHIHIAKKSRLSIASYQNYRLVSRRLHVRAAQSSLNLQKNLLVFAVQTCRGGLQLPREVIVQSVAQLANGRVSLRRRHVTTAAEMLQRTEKEEPTAKGFIMAKPQQPAPNEVVVTAICTNRQRASRYGHSRLVDFGLGFVQAAPSLRARTGPPNPLRRRSCCHHPWLPWFKLGQAGGLAAHRPDADWTRCGSRRSRCTVTACQSLPGQNRRSDDPPEFKQLPPWRHCHRLFPLSRLAVWRSVGQGQTFETYSLETKTAAIKTDECC